LPDKDSKNPKLYIKFLDDAKITRIWEIKKLYVTFLENSNSTISSRQSDTIPPKILNSP